MENEHITTEQASRLITVLEKLETEIEKQNSLKRALVRGAVYGLGTVVGATLLVAIFGSLIASTANIFNNDPVISESL